MSRPLSVVVGANGRLARAIRNALDDRQPAVFDRRSAARWLDGDGRRRVKTDLVDSRQKMRRYLSRQA